MERNNSALIVKVAGKEIEVNKPDAIIPNIELVLYKQKMDPKIAIEALIDGYTVLIVDFYSSGLMILNELKKSIEKNYTNQSFKSQRDFRSLYRELSNRVLLAVSNHQLTVRKAPEIGWLKILYPELNEFLLPFPQVQGLNSSWQWYQKGISIPVLKYKIYPFFGTYFPTRFEHLKLFENWLKQYKGEKKSAIDVGIGCGVLSFQLLEHQFKKIYGTDSNHNAIIGLTQEFAKNKLYSNIELLQGDLFANCNVQTELIVFNPPWIPATHHIEGIDMAIYYDTQLFPRFFSEAVKHLKINGRIVVLFSNLAQITNLSESHPIEEELLKGGRFQKELFIQKNVAKASKNTKRNQNWRASEMVELWVLKLIDTHQ